jgi:hypothetical protein
MNNKRLTQILLPLCILVLLSLGGCVRYDLGIDFQHQHQGKIFQTIELSQQFTDFSSAEAQQWLETIESRAKSLGGKVERRSRSGGSSPQTVLVTIPFSNSEELESSFNRFFHPDQSSHQANLTEALQLDSTVAVEHNNLLLAERNHLHLTVDLRALGVLSEQGKLVISPGALLDLRFRLSTPWGVKIEDNQSDMVEAIETNPNGVVWQLQPGEINTIDVVYWLPSRIGIGSLIILALIWIGSYLKYGLLRNQTSLIVPPNAP